MKYPGIKIRSLATRLCPFWLSLFAIGLVVLPPSITAQEETDDEEVFELSPFVVEEESTEGYLATQTLAGTRLRTSIQDVGASIQILTSEYLDDIGAVEAEDYLLFTTNTETFGLGGNFSGAADRATAEGAIDINDARNDSGRGNRVRGIGGADRTRDYFKSAISNDSYNTERIEINRGANSILFGLGSPSGVVNSGLARAKFRDETEIEFRISDGWDDKLSHRTTLDFNREIFEDKLAFRFIGLLDRRKYDQFPAYKNQERYYATAIWRATPTITIRGNVETGITEANRPDPTGPLEAWSHYLERLAEFNDYGASNDPFVYDPYGYPNRTHGALNQNLFDNVQQLGSRFMQIFLDPQATESEGLVPARTNTNLWETTKGKPDHPFWPDVGGNGKLRNQLRFKSINNAGAELRDRYYIGIQDLDIFDFSRTLFFGNASFQNRKFDSYNLSLEQSFFNGMMGYEVAFNKEFWSGDDYSAFTGNSNSIQIDLNETLWYGPPELGYAPNVPNPNFGRPFVRGQQQTDERADDRQTIRLTTYAKIDFRDYFEGGLGNWLGNHVITGLVNRYERESWNWRYREYLTPPQDAFDNLWETYDSNIGARRIDSLIYIGDAIDLISNPNGLTMQDLKLPSEPINARVFTPGIVRDATFFNRSDQEWQTIPFSSDVTFNGGTIRSELVDSAAFVLQSFLFNGHLIPTYGMRYDEFTLERLPDGDQAGVEELEADPSLIWNQVMLVHPLDPENRSFDLNNQRTVRHTNSGTTHSFGAVLKFPEKWFELPFNTDLRLYFNKSENFDPDPGRQDQYGNVLESPAGETTEYGFNISMFDRRLHARINRYEASLNGATTGAATGAFNSAINAGGFYIMQRLLRDRARGNPTETEEVEVTLPDGTIVYEEQLVYPYYNDVLQAIDDLSDFYGITIDFDNGTWSADGNNPYSQIWTQGEIELELNPNGEVIDLDRENIQGLADTQDLNVKGYEFEIIYNPVRNWRISINASKTETISSNSVPRLQEWIDIFTPVLGSITETSQVPTLIGNLDRSNPADQPPDSQGPTYFDWWRSNVLVREQGLVALDGLPTPEASKWRFSMVTNYTFRDGPLEGFRIGGNLRWQDKIALGFPQITTTVEDEDGNLETVVIGSLVDQPYYDKDRVFVGLNFGYDRKLNWGGRKIDWSLRVNVSNINTKRRDLVPVSVQPAPTLEEMYVAEVRTNAPLGFSITNRFRF